MDKKNVTECTEMFENFAKSEYVKKPRGGNSNPATRTPSSAQGVHQVNLDTGMPAALENLTRVIKELKTRVDKCEMCRGGHGSTEQNLAAQIKAITTRSGRVLGPEVRRNEIEVEDEEVMDEEIEMEVPGKVQNTALVTPPVVKKPVEVRPSPSVAHSPLQHMPKYAKFLRDLLKRKDRLGEVSSIPLMGDCSAVVLNRVPEKLSDPSVFTIPVLFGSDAMSHALADLGASINLMP
ncbi:uncharacterized protein LOC143589020 [Bidens hawaiensis]|uniref:uncharacterized protein LOC143589020 n=1 Tax=Bidens hawaiensis TaxID=980011 RepID=UPI00404B7CC0